MSIDLDREHHVTLAGLLAGFLWLLSAGLLVAATATGWALLYPWGLVAAIVAMTLTTQRMVAHQTHTIQNAFELGRDVARYMEAEQAGPRRVK